MGNENTRRTHVPTPSVRRRTDGDLDACVRALEGVHREDRYPMNWPGDPGAWLTPPTLLAAWVAELDGRVAGHVVLSASDGGDVAPGLWSAHAGVGPETTAVVNRLFVAPWARGHGLGALLMARAAAEAGERGLHPVLDVVASDAAAAALYERLGWRLLGTVEEWWEPEQRVDIHCYAASG
ncbi:Acetyltransferase (GNAT) family protein [Streptomyces zhaozhouensis]|uniref:Probable N-acetyltransferase 14 n=1 Tax=Streptomyces zhaozhouensis TaxID=1300267 RepID=A0A286DK44_9ACTN|nr:GNAT family N-acetyltransferase [Streptomyces zhaozhouensis]SOD59125.1 Acetyltransferase (GNAT) family protein [Streptomyces zhaozhouensis]